MNWFLWNWLRENCCKAIYKLAGRAGVFKKENIHRNCDVCPCSWHYFIAIYNITLVLVVMTHH